MTADMESSGAGLRLPDWEPFDEDQNALAGPDGDAQPLPERAYEVVAEAHAACRSEYGDEGGGYHIGYLAEVLALNGWQWVGGGS